MTGIQRWDCVTEYGPESTIHGAMEARPLVGDYVTYADHVETLRKSEGRAWADDITRAYEQGQRDMLDKFATDPLRVLQSYEQGKRDALAGAVQRVKAHAIVGMTAEGEERWISAELHEIIAALMGES